MEFGRENERHFKMTSVQNSSSKFSVMLAGLYDCLHHYLTCSAHRQATADLLGTGIPISVICRGLLPDLLEECF